MGVFIAPEFARLQADFFVGGRNTITLPLCCGGTGNQCTAISLPKETWPRAVCRRMAKSESERTIAFTLKNRDGPADTHCLSGTPLVPSSAGGMWLKARSLDAQFEFLAGSNAQV